jgi:hypothetical protein
VESESAGAVLEPLSTGRVRRCAVLVGPSPETENLADNSSNNKEEREGQKPGETCTFSGVMSPILHGLPKLLRSNTKDTAKSVRTPAKSVWGVLFLCLQQSASKAGGASRRRRGSRNGLGCMLGASVNWLPLRPFHAPREAIQGHQGAVRPSLSLATLTCDMVSVSRPRCDEIEKARLDVKPSHTPLHHIFVQPHILEPFPAMIAAASSSRQCCFLPKLHYFCM